MKRLGIVCGGASYHHRALNHPKYRRFFHEHIYLLNFPQTDLSRLDGLLIPERLHQGRLLVAQSQLEVFLTNGKNILVFGEQPEPLLPGVRWEQRPTNFWWWTKPGESSGLVLARSEHSLFRYLTLSDATWHYHGVFWPPERVESLIETEDGGSVLYLDRISTSGALLLTTLDPFYYFGSYFMPATERFLDGFLPWVAEELL